MSGYYAIRCLRCAIRRLRAEIIALDGTPPRMCCVVVMPGGPTAFAISRLRCQRRELQAILAELEAVP